MKLYDAKTSFAAGELSPVLHARIDLAQYHVGARTIRNFIVLPQGALVNRPGTTVLDPERSYGAVRLVPFVFSEEDSCVLAFGDGFVDRYSFTGFRERIPDSPYKSSHLARLRWLQSADVLYLFHPDVPIHMLRREMENGHRVWKFAKVELDKGPFEDTNTDETKKLSFTERPDFKYDLHANFPLFLTWDLLEALLKVEVKVKAWSDTLTLKPAGVTAFGEPVTVRNVFGAFSYRTTGKWTGTVKVERCEPDNWVGKNDPSEWVWEPYKEYFSDTDAEENFSFSGVVEEYATHFRFSYAGPKKRVIVAFDYAGGVIERVFRVKEIISQQRAIVEDVEKKGGYIPETDAWAIGAFGPHYGYPSMGIFHQERLVLARTRHSPQSIWMSQPASWHDFSTSIPAKDSDAITVTLASTQINEIRGLASRGDLLLLTSGGEWQAKAGAKTDVFTPSSIVITPSGYRGSHMLAPLDVGDVTLFVQRHGTTVRSMGYSLEVDGYSSSDLSILAAHMFENNPVVAWAYQQTPWSVVWCVLADGTVGALTIQREHQVTAWTRQVFGPQGHKVEDVCCIPGATQDDVYFVVRRGNGLRVERLHRRSDTGGEESFRDAGAHTVHSVLECLDWEQSADGTLQGRHKQVPALTLRLLRTVSLKGGIVTENRGELDMLQFPDADSPGASAVLYTGDVRLVAPGGFGRVCRVRLENDSPTPATILGIFPEVVVDEN
ncbi:hypothetical protein [uncultured Fretibacterium sp.]|uniref:hypothetical protein n=1 Tax=uncultured Fretibacterium sp. TaxID=1678694 RepID=UPI00325F97D0